MEIHINTFPKCQCGNDLMAMFDQARESNETYIKGWYCPECNKLYLLSAGEMRWKEGKAWVDKTENRPF